MIEVASLCGQICLGKQGENLARMVCFEEPSTWKEIFGEGKCELIHQRNGDESPYPVVLDVEDDKVIWKITNADTAIVGEGKCELHYFVDGVIVKSKIWTTTVLPSLSGDLAEPPEPQKAWVDEVLSAAEDVKSATTHQAIIGDNGNWYIWDAELKEYVDSGHSSKGEYGKCNIVGAKAFTIIDIDTTNKTFTLDDVTGLVVGDVYSAFIVETTTSNQYENAGKIIEINGNVVKVDVIPEINDFTTLDSYLDENDVDTEENTFRIVTKPTVGTRNIGFNAHAEGYQNSAISKNAHAEGFRNVSYGSHSHTEGRDNTAGYNAHAEGLNTEATGFISHSEGVITKATAYASHAEGQESTASGIGSHSEGFKTESSGKYSHSEGSVTEASGNGSHAEGNLTNATNSNAHAEGYDTTSSGVASHSEGYKSDATGDYSHAEGNDTTASGIGSHSEGKISVASGDGSHAEGGATKATNDYAHAEGLGSEANGDKSHAEGYSTKANGSCSHSEGTSTTAEGSAAHAEGGNTNAVGKYSHAEGFGTVSTAEAQHVEGKYNIEDTDKKFAHILGNGTGSKNRSNAHTVDWYGNAWYNGSVECTGVILKSPGGKRFVLLVDDNGNLSTMKI